MEFVVKVINTFNIGTLPHQSRVAVVLFGDVYSTELVFDFNKFTSRADLAVRGRAVE